MTRKAIHVSWLAVLCVAFGCGGSTRSDAADEGGTTAPNAVALIVDPGPAGAQAQFDVPYVTVSICVPGTTTCQSVDHVAVDTGSSGLRILSSVLQGSMVLPQVNATTGDALVECSQFVDGYTWGPVKLADIKLGGELAANMPIQIIGDPAYEAAVPTGCSQGGPSEDTLASFGSNGLLGINQLVADCGDACTRATEGGYYSCSGGTCAAVGVAEDAQIANPIASFATDNNGAVMQFGTVPATGAATLSGTLIFGIGTQSNNGLGGAQVLTLDPYGNFTTLFDGQTLTTSYIDSGTNLLALNDSAIPACTSPEVMGFFCPTSTVNLTAQNEGVNGVTTTVSFSVANAQALFDDASDVVFDDIAAPYGNADDTTFAWGFPFFIGRSVFIGLQGATTPGGNGPFVAY